MRELFPGFYKRTEEELSLFREKATFVLDTNILLNIYRYKEETRTRFFEILEKLREKGRLWIPHQVIYEYLSNRVKVINEQTEAYRDVHNAINDARDSLESLEHLKNKHSIIKIEEIIDLPIKALTEANGILSASRNTSKNEFDKLLKDSVSDIYREKFANLFQGIVGEAYKNEQLISFYSLADKRFELQIPPGWKDKTKKNYGKYGDAIIWFQLLDYAGLHNANPIIFVTDDKKSDWYLSIENAYILLGQKNNDRPVPRPELVQEMLVETGVLLQIYDGDEFFEEATKALELIPEPNVSTDVKRVTEQNTINHEIHQVFVTPSVEELINIIPHPHTRRRILMAMRRMEHNFDKQDGIVYQTQMPINPLDGEELWILPVLDYRLINLIQPNGNILAIGGFQKDANQTESYEYEMVRRAYERYLQEQKDA